MHQTPHSLLTLSIPLPSPPPLPATATTTPTTILEEKSKTSIDDLPDPILSHILSFLPTQNAVATSLVSKRWKPLWTSITTLNLDGRAISKLMVFINSLFLRIPPPSIHSFCFNVTQSLFDSSNLHYWILHIAPTVRQLDLHIYLYLYVSPKKKFKFQANDFHFKKLVVLKLNGSIDFNVPALASVCFPNLETLHLDGIGFEISSDSSISFPNLKILHFDDVRYKNEDSVHKLLSSCPVLDVLNITIGNRDNTISLTICIPSLTRLKLGFWGYDDSPPEFHIADLHKLKFLSIWGDAPKAIWTTSARISSDFNYLTTLELEVHDCRELSVVIQNLLDIMDNLEHITILRSRSRCPCSHGSLWTERMNVPKCLLSRVTTISFIQSIDDCRDELEVVRYLLKNAKVLQLLKLGTKSCSSERKLKLIEKVSMFPKGSQACQVEFT